jgi:hypothetical protein
MKLIIVFAVASISQEQRDLIEHQIQLEMIKRGGGLISLHHHWQQPDRKYNPKNPFNRVLNESIYAVLDAVDVSPTACVRAPVIAAFEN